MSRMLTLIHGGWSAIQELARNGRRIEALASVKLLLARQDLPESIAVEARLLAAELELEAGRFKKTRGHLRTIVVARPLHARARYLMGLAFENDPDAEDRRAAICFRKASELEAGNALYRAAHGRALINSYRVRSGVHALLAAAKMISADLPVIRIVVSGLIDAGRMKSARQVLNRARFRMAKHRELDRLEAEVRFESARRLQNKRSKQDAIYATDGDFTPLPFLRLAGPHRPKSPAPVRSDILSMPRPHFTRFLMTRADG